MIRLPVNSAIITSPYGYRTDPITGKAGVFHDGVDYISKDGDRTVYSISNGAVTYIFNKYNPTERWDLTKESAAGNYLIYSIIFDGGLYYIKPLHFEKINDFKVGDKLTIGENLGEYGDVGYSAGAHTHLYCYNEFWKKIDPSFLFKGLL
jgi:murein DD-endopeptidase MepM/ murein hydrolase activator NlpD